VSENEQAVFYLIREVFSNLQIPLVIAGSHPGEALIRLISAYEHIALRHNPSQEEMDQLLSDAHIHVLPTFQNTGIKLKLLNSLYKGRFVVVNEPMVANTGLEFGTVICRSTEEFRGAIQDLWQEEFGEIELAQREAAVGETFSSRRNAQLLIETIRKPKRKR
ncbi:MAG: glycosyltransferase, partial [Bacteroidota bacterium]